MIAFFKSIGFKIFNTDSSIFIQQIKKEGIMLITIYINDFLLATNKQNLLDWIKKALRKESNVKNLGKVKTIIN